MTRAMVLAAGFGTRLRPLTDELPKPLLPLGDRSLLEHALAAFRGAGLGESVVVNVHHLAAEFERRRAELGASVELVVEPAIRGTAGGIAGARALLGPAPIVAMIGDVLIERVPPDFAEHARGGGLVLAVAARPRGSGTVGVGPSGELVRLRGEHFGDESTGGDYVGLAALGAEALAALPVQGCLVGDFALPALRRGVRVMTYPFTGEVVLPGDDLPSFWRANLAWLARKKSRGHVGRGAHVESEVLLDQALVGDQARVEGRGRLTRVVILPGASCRAPLADAIVAPSGHVINILESKV